MSDVEEKIKEMLEKIRPMLQMDGGDGRQLQIHGTMLQFILIYLMRWFGKN